MKPGKKRDVANEIVRTADVIGFRFLAGRGPAFQSAVIAELLARYLAGCPPQHRDQMLAIFLDLAHDLTRVNAQQLRGEGEPKH